MKTPGQAAYEKYVNAMGGDLRQVPWKRVTASRRRVWESVATAAMEAHNAFAREARAELKPAALVTHGGLEHGHVVVFTGQEDDCRPWVIAKLTCTNGMSTLRLYDPKSRRTLEGIDFSRVRKIDPRHLNQAIEVVVEPKRKR